MRVVVVLLALTVMVSCHKVSKPKKPDNLIPENKMVNVIIDVSILTAAKGVDRKELEDRGILPKEFVYEKHGIDSLQFALSNNYYAYDIPVYEAIYAKVNDSLKALKDVFKTEQDEAIEAKRKADSLKKKSVTPKKYKGKDLSGTKLDSLIKKR